MVKRATAAKASASADAPSTGGDRGNRWRVQRRQTDHRRAPRWSRYSTPSCAFTRSETASSLLQAACRLVDSNSPLLKENGSLLVLTLWSRISPACSCESHAGVSGVGFAHSLNQVARLDIFEQIALGAGPDGRKNFVVFPEAGQDEHPGLRSAA